MCQAQEHSLSSHKGTLPHGSDELLLSKGGREDDATREVPVPINLSGSGVPCRQTTNARSTVVVGNQSVLRP